jgi:hypothetical protein
MRPDPNWVNSDGTFVSEEAEQLWNAQLTAWQDTIAAEQINIRDVRESLTDAIALIDLYPAPTVEETALIDLQINDALTAFRTLSEPPADILAMSSSLISWRSTL